MQSVPPKVASRTTISRKAEAIDHGANRVRGIGRFHRLFAGFVIACSCATTLPAQAADSKLVDRAVVRYIAPELGGAFSPRFVFERELSFEARLQALSDPERLKEATRPYYARHIRSALERHVAEALLANLRVDPIPTEAELAHQTELARGILYDQVGGESAFLSAAAVEGIAEREITNLLRRQARASIYLDRMVAPMLTPTRTELRQVYAVEHHPFVQQSFEEAEAALRQWWIANRLADAVEQFFSDARQRVSITLLIEPRDVLESEPRAAPG